MTQRELNKITRKLGNQMAVEYRESTPGLSEQLARRAPLEELRLAHETAIVMDRLPRDAPFRLFRIGWRGAYTIAHGTSSGYSQGCRCEECREAWRLYQKGRYKVRRQALAVVSAANGMRPFVEGTRMIAERAKQIRIQSATDAWVASMDPEATRLKAEIMKMKQRLAELGETE